MVLLVLKSILRLVVIASDLLTLTAIGRYISIYFIFVSCQVRLARVETVETVFLEILRFYPAPLKWFEVLSVMDILITQTDDKCNPICSIRRRVILSTERLGNIECKLRYCVTMKMYNEDKRPVYRKRETM